MAEAEAPIPGHHCKRPWCWEWLKAGGEGDNRGWDGWMVSLTQWTWVWVDSGSWWWTGRPGVLRFTGSQRVRHNWVTELNWTEYWHRQEMVELGHETRQIQPSEWLRHLSYWLYRVVHRSLPSLDYNLLTDKYGLLLKSYYSALNGTTVVQRNCLL